MRSKAASAAVFAVRVSAAYNVMPNGIPISVREKLYRSSFGRSGGAATIVAVTNIPKHDVASMEHCVRFICVICVICGSPPDRSTDFADSTDEDKEGLL